MADVNIKEVEGGVTGTINDTDAIEIDTGTTSYYALWSTVKSLLQTVFDSRYRRLGSTMIEGIKLTWNSTTSVTVGVGSCYAENGDFINITSALVKSGLSLSASTWYHIYVYLSGGVAAAEVVTTAPVAWKGTAYSKTGDTSRRYVGSIKSDGSSNVLNFQHYPHLTLIEYQNQQDAAPFRVLTNGKATTETSISCTGAVPVTSQLIKAKFSNTDASVNAWLGNSIDSITLAAGVAILAVNANTTPICEFPVDSSQALTYLFTSGPVNGLYVDIYGYYFSR